jgi:hypothetical protein
LKFIGRKTELAKLKSFFKDELSHCALIYGRRRIGKSELIKQSIKEFGKNGLYYECKQTSEKNNVESLSEILSYQLGFPKLAFNSLEELVDFLFKYSKDKKIILVFDEYSYLQDTIKGLDSILQTLIDKYSEQSGLKIIICGSFIDSMKSLLSNQNPLFGRVDLVLNLKQMDYYESSLFYKTFSNEDKIRLYSVFGGVPYYNRLINPNKSVKGNIIELIASKGSRLEMAIPMNLKSEISKLINANEVFEVLAKGFTKFSDILSQSHVSSSPTLADILEKLIKMEIVKKEAPINDEQNKKKAGYYINDNFSLFYYKYIFNHLSQLNIMSENDFYEKYINDDFEKKYVPKIFEKVCREYLIRQNLKGKLEEPFEKIGKYYFDNPVEKTNGEFDIVTWSQKGYVFYEAKFTKEPISSKVINKEIEQVNNSGLSAIKYGFISKSGFKTIRNNTIIKITLDDLFGAKD